MSKVSWLNLHHHFSRDIRKLIYRKLTHHERYLTELAHGLNPKPVEIGKYAAKRGWLNLVRWAHRNGQKIKQTAIIKAAKHNHQHVLQWLNMVGCKKPLQACDKAAKYNHFKLLQWLKANGWAWHVSTCANAAKSGHLHILKWLRDSTIHEDVCPWDEYTCAVASKHGHLHVLEWLKPNTDCTALVCPSDTSIIRSAVRSGHFEILKWLYHMKIQLQALGDIYVCELAAKSGHFEILKWLRDPAVHGDKICPWEHKVCEHAAEKGHIEILIWALQNGAPPSPHMFNNAAINGHLHIVQWLHVNRNEYPYRDHYTLYVHGNFQEIPISTKVANRGYLHILQWLEKHKYIIGGMSYSAAASGGHLHILEWLNTNNYAPTGDPSASAARNNNPEIMQWLYGHGIVITTDAIETAVMYGNLKVAQWIHNNISITYINKSRLAITAAEHGYLEILQWLLENGCPWTDRISAVALDYRKYHILDWTSVNHPLSSGLILQAYGTRSYPSIKYLLGKGVPVPDEVIADLQHEYRLQHTDKDGWKHRLIEKMIKNKFMSTETCPVAFATYPL